jgi:hypothetical protein
MAALHHYIRHAAQRSKSACTQPWRNNTKGGFIMSDTTIANDVIWDHEQFEVNIGGGNCTFSTYAWINFDVWATVKYKGQQFDINLQNGWIFG